MSLRRVESASSSGSDSRYPPSSFTPTQTYSHVSTYRSLQMELQLYSTSIKVQQENSEDQGPLAVFGDHDQVGGKVILDPSCNNTGRLSISIEGAFMYSPTHVEGDQVAESSLNPGKRKHVFFSSSTTLSTSTSISISTGSEPNSPRSVFRDAFIKRRPSASSLNSSAAPVERIFPFTFDLPRSCRAGEELPPSFTGSTDIGSSTESFDVTYKLKVVWEANNTTENPSTLEVPILFYPDADFQSADASPQSPQSWLEMPLRSDRPIPFRCAVTLPTSVTFARASHIPYFAVFTTIPRSPDLVKEIAADATISVSLLRQVTVTEQSSGLLTPPLTPSTSSDDSHTPRHKLLKRVAQGSQSRLTSAARVMKAFDENTELRDKPLPRLPTHSNFTESRTLQNSICIGFPKRPRQLSSESRNHPSLDSHAALPDGLHRAKIALQKDMLPCIDWAGVSVKYYLDVSVLIGQDDLRARIPIRII